MPAVVERQYEMAAGLRERTRSLAVAGRAGVLEVPRKLLKDTRAAARRPAMIVLWIIVAVGLLLRIYFIRQWRPALIGFPDTSVYILDAHLGIFFDPLRIGGYALFLQLFHELRPHLSFAIGMQHLMGVASGLFLFGAVRRAGLPEWIALAPAVVVILGGSELFVEHAPLAESVFIFVIDLALYAIVRTWKGSWGWALLAGLMLGTSAIVRSVGLAMLPFLVLVVLFAASGAWRPRLLRTALLIFAAAVPIAAYLIAHQDQTGFGGFTETGYFDLYGRVAPFADCRKFHPPASTQRLCITMPVSKRPGNALWEFTGISPAIQVYGPAEFGPPPQHGENTALRRFAMAAILGQPLDYLTYVGRDLVRIIYPNFSTSPYGVGGYGNTPESLLMYYFNPSNDYALHIDIAGYYPSDGYIHRDISALMKYERDTRLEGPFMIILLLLTLVAPILTTGAARRGAILFGSSTLLLLAAPIFLSEYDYRFTIPAFGPLAATAGIGAWAVWIRAQPRLMRAQPLLQRTRERSGQNP